MKKLHKSEEILRNLALQSGLGCPTTGSKRSQHGYKSLSTKTLADSFYNDQLLPCLISSPGWLLVTGTWNTMTSSKRTLEVRPSTSLYSVGTEEHYSKSRHTLSQLFSHSDRIKQQRNWKLIKLWVQVRNSTVYRLQEVISMASTV